MYQDKVQKVKEAYEPKIRSLLTKLQEQMRKRGYQITEIDDMTDEEYHWSFVIHPFPVANQEVGRWHQGDLGVDFYINESLPSEGTEDGITFRLDCMGTGGRVYASFAPYNFTPKCWVSLDDEEEISDRFEEVADDAEYLLDTALDAHSEDFSDYQPHYIDDPHQQFLF